MGQIAHLLERPGPIGSVGPVGGIHDHLILEGSCHGSENAETTETGVEYCDHRPPSQHVIGAFTGTVADFAKRGILVRPENAVALITGGASGLGLGAARRLSGLGAKVVLADINDAKGDEALGALGESARFVHCDVSDPADVEAAIAATLETFERIDLLVNAAGIAPAQRVVSRDGSLHDLEVFRQTVAINLIGMFDVIRNAAGAMSANDPGEGGERGVIINVASIAAYDGQIGQAAYSASKGGIVGMTLPLARDLAGVGVRVVTIAPGIMDTPLLSGAPQELKDSLAGLAAFPKRLGTPDDFAHLVVAVMENEMLNGEVIRLDAAARMPAK